MIDYLISYSDVTNFSVYSNIINFTLSASDTIYDVSYHGITPRYVINFGNNKIPKSFLFSDYDDVSYFDRAIEKTQYVGLFNTFLHEDDTIVIVSARYKTDRYLIFYNKKDKSVKTVKGIIDNHSFLSTSEILKFKSLPKGSHKNELYTIIEPYTILENAELLKQDIKNSGGNLNNNPTLSLIDSLKIIDNPLIQISKLKY